MRLIDKDWVELHEVTAAGSMSEYGRGWNEALAYVVENAPTIESEPVRHGRWIFKHNPITDPKSYFIRIVCSECNLHTGQKSNYCPKCGAKMDQEAQP